MEYIQRIVDNTLDKRKEAFNAISIIGPKGCGKPEPQKSGAIRLLNFKMKKNEMDTWRLPRLLPSFS